MMAIEYRVKVTEKHSDIVTVIADSAEEARDKAVSEADCQFDSVYDCEIISETETTTKGEEGGH